MSRTLGHRGMTHVSVAGASAGLWVVALAMMASMRHGGSMGPLHGPLDGFPFRAVMWTVMMWAMMLPSASPMLATLAGLSRRTQRPPAAAGRGAAFAAGYLLAWGCFGLAAAAVQQALASTDLLTHGRVGAIAGGGLLVAAGVYQMLPAKQSCLTRCRAPLGFLLNHWREGYGGALAMGVRHGLWCLGCCVALMVVLFAVGVMHIGWMVALALLVLAEKTTPHGHLLARGAGIALVVYGLTMLIT
jgi:predicted metal-binding membrane protein